MTPAVKSVNKAEGKRMAKAVSPKTFNAPAVAQCAGEELRKSPDCSISRAVRAKLTSSGA